MEIIIVAIFVIGYAAIVFEHTIKVNKASSALITGMLCWTVYILTQTDKETVSHQLLEHLGDLSGILFFLMGAMTIVELVDAHDGFQVVTQRIKTKNKRKLLWILSVVTFFLSAVLDNLTTTIVMLSLLRKMVDNRNDRLLFAGMMVIAANAGGAWSPIGDVTTTMLWIGNQITSFNIITRLFLPSLVCLLVPLLLVSPQIKGNIQLQLTNDDKEEGKIPSTEFERNVVFTIGIAGLLFVPVFKTITHLPPFMGILLSLGIVWLLTELIHGDKDEADKGFLSVTYALRKIDTPSILFFLGILIAISALQSVGVLQLMAGWMAEKIPNDSLTVMLLGFLSSVIDNVPLVAAAQGMYSLNYYPTDHYFWEFLAYCTGTGGSTFIIGSAAGVAAMGIEKIDFFWYLKKITLIAILGYLAGAFVYIALSY